MRGRRPKPAALKEAQGNPGHRTIVDVAEPQGSSPPEKARAFPFKVSDDAQRVYDLIAPELERINFLRPSDQPAFRRYCDTLARYWRVTEQIDTLGGETYECKTTTGETMQRLRPQFIVQDRLARRLDTQEDRFGLTPMARQQYMLTLARGTQLPMNFGGNAQQLAQNNAPAVGPSPAPAPSIAPRVSLIGGARGLPN